MTKVLIVSDSHGMRSELQKLVQRHEHEVKHFIHCGDSELAVTDKEISSFSVVRGNCDYEEYFKDELVDEYAGMRFFITHGHLFSVKSSLMGLQYRAQELNARIVCFGHSHLLGAEVVKNVLFVNPGSLRLPRGRKERTYVILEITGNEVEFRVYDLDAGEISDLASHFTLASL